MSIKLIIFDFDGTLGDTRRNIVTTMQMAIKEMQLPERSEAECAATIGLPFLSWCRQNFGNSEGTRLRTHHRFVAFTQFSHRSDSQYGYRRLHLLFNRS